MPQTYLYCPKKGGSFADFAHETAVPINNSYAVTRDNAYVVPMWAHQSGTPIPVTSQAAQALQQYNVPGSIVPVPYVPNARQIQQDRPGWFDGVNFNAVASLLTRVFMDYLDSRNRKDEPLWQQIARAPAAAINAFSNYKANPEPINRSNFLTKAAPVIGTVANAFLPGWGRLLTSGLSSLGSKIFGHGLKRGGKRKASGKKKKANIVFSNASREILGKKVSFKKDLKKVSDETLKERAQNSKWRKIISSAFTSAIKTVAPAIGSGRLILGRKINKSKLKMKGGKKNGKDHMAWVRSFIGKKGKGLKGGRRRRRKRVGGSSKMIVYKRHGVYYPKPAGKNLGSGAGKRRRRKRGRGLVSSGIYGKGDPRDFSGWPSRWYPKD